MMHPDLVPAAVLAAYADLDDGAGRQPATSLPVTRLSGGLINDTFALGSSYVIQRLHPIFRAEVNLDIAALTPHLAAAGVPVPRIVAAADGQPWTLDDQGVPWRVLTRLPGETRHRLASPAQTRAAATMVAQFHQALGDVQHTFAFTRPGAHDTDKHMRTLAVAVAAHEAHPLHAEVSVIAAEIQARWQDWGQIPQLPTRIVHGDLKVSNLLWQGDAVSALLDLDTMAHGTLDIELGDALRSWCNRTTEDDPNPAFDVDLFQSAVGAYIEAAGDWLTEPERLCLPAAVERIALELAARFAADALQESYFGWDAGRFSTRGQHNLVRARNQLGLARDVARHRPALQASLHSAHKKSH